MAKRFLDIEENEVILYEDQHFELSVIEDLLTGDFVEGRVIIENQSEYKVDKEVYKALSVLKDELDHYQNIISLNNVL